MNDPANCRMCARLGKQCEYCHRIDLEASGAIMAEQSVAGPTMYLSPEDFTACRPDSADETVIDGAVYRPGYHGPKLGTGEPMYLMKSLTPEQLARGREIARKFVEGLKVGRSVALPKAVVDKDTENWRIEWPSPPADEPDTPVITAAR